MKNGCPDFTEKERIHLGQELSDVLMSLVRLSQLCHIDLPKAVLEKFEHNAAKYPPSKAFGSCKKYTEYDNDGSSQEEAGSSSKKAEYM